MGWSGQIVNSRGDWVSPKGPEKAAWKAARDQHLAKFGNAPFGFENGYICLSDTYTTASKMGYSISNMDFDADEVATLAEAFERELPLFLEDEPGRAFHAEYLVAFFKTAAKFKRGVRGGH